MKNKIINIFLWIFINSILISGLIVHQCFASHMYDSFDSQSTFNPVGSGARALGMSGAFIGVADDATAASWNPGGLIQLSTSEISIVGSLSHWTESHIFDHEPKNNFSASVSDIDVNYLSIVSPTFEWFGRCMLFSLNYQHLYNFPREWDYDYFQNNKDIKAHSIKHYKQKGKLYAIGIAGCMQINKSLSLGITINIWNDLLGENGWYQTNNSLVFTKSEIFESVRHAYFENRYAFKGLNFNIGILWDITESLAMGAVIKTPFTADLAHRLSSVSKTQYLSSTSTEVKPNYYTLYDYTLYEELDMPMSSGIGFSYRFSEYLTLSADIHRTEWQDFILKNHQVEYSSFISSKKEYESEVDPTHNFRFGMEYLIFNKQNRWIIPVRGGIFYEQAPAEGNPNKLLGCSLGTGFSKGPYNFDIAVQYRYYTDGGQSKILVENHSEELNEYQLYSSFIYHFSE